MSNTTSTATAKPAAKRAPRKTVAPKAAETVAPAATDDEVFTALPKRAYTLNRPAAHADFFDKVRKDNEGKSNDERVYRKFPAPSKGVSAAIKRGVYAAIQPGEFEASNRTVDGALQVFVTVAAKKS